MFRESGGQGRSLANEICGFKTIGVNLYGKLSHGLLSYLFDICFICKSAHNAGTRIYSPYFNQFNARGRLAGWWQKPADLLI